MYYKNYLVSYIDYGESIVCCEMTRDMTNFIDTDENPGYKYIKRPFEINRYQYEHARDYLDENGLFIGIFPPEVIEQDIREWNETQEIFKKETEKAHLERLKKPLRETSFKLYFEKRIDRDFLVDTIENFNKKAYDTYGLIFTFEDYIPVLNKYGIRYTENRETGIWTGKNIL